MTTGTKAAEKWLELETIDVPVGGRVCGEVRPPSSKSVSHRMMNLTLLSNRAATIEHLLDAEDLQLFRDAFDSWGWNVDGADDRLLLRPPNLLNQRSQEAEVYCGNAGTMFRFVVASSCVIPGSTIVDGSERLRERPIGPLVRALEVLGAQIEFLGKPGCAPLRVQGGSLRAGKTSIDAGESSQYLSALLMACGALPQPSWIEVESLVSTPYVDVTLAAIERFGWEVPAQREAGVWTVPACREESLSSDQDRVLKIEADYSAAAYPAAAAMISGGSVRLAGLDRQSVQGDRKFLDVLCRAGGEMKWEGELLHFSGAPTRSLDVDLGDMPDQVPTLAAIAAFCPGRTVITNVAHLRIKESDRLRAIAVEWGKLGILVRETPDGLEVEGRPDLLTESQSPQRVEVETYDDHRIAMSAALVGLRRPLTVRDPGVVAKSYPEFWADFLGLLA